MYTCVCVHSTLSVQVCCVNFSSHSIGYMYMYLYHACNLAMYNNIATSYFQEHDIPETMNLQVVCEGQVIASTEFTYYANAQYHSDLLYQYLTSTFPTYYPDNGGAVGWQMLQVKYIVLLHYC